MVEYNFCTYYILENNEYANTKILYIFLGGKSWDFAVPLLASVTVVPSERSIKWIHFFKLLQIIMENQYYYIKGPFRSGPVYTKHLPFKLNNNTKFNFVHSLKKIKHVRMRNVLLSFTIVEWKNTVNMKSKIERCHEDWNVRGERVVGRWTYLMMEGGRKRSNGCGVWWRGRTKHLLSQPGSDPFLSQINRAITLANSSPFSLQCIHTTTPSSHPDFSHLHTPYFLSTKDNEPTFTTLQTIFHIISK